MNFGEVLSRAWQIIWKYKILWIFGILAGLGQGTPNNPGNNSRYEFNNNNASGFYLGNQYISFDAIARWFEANWWIFIILTLLALLVVVVVIILSTFGRIGLARGAWQADEGKEKLTFGQLFGESSPFFWRVFGLVLVITILWIAFFLILGGAAVGFTVITAGIGALCLIPLFLVLCCLLIPVSWGVSVITEQAIVAITCENMGLFDGLKRGWQVLRDNLGPATIMFLILGIGGGIVRLLIGIPLVAALVPLGIAAFTGTTEAWTVGGIASLVVVCVYLPIAIALNGVVTAYTGTAWVLTYRRLTGLKAGSPAAEVVTL